MKYLLGIIGIITVFSVSAQDLTWTSIHDIEDSMAKEVKPVLIKIETPWCYYCKLMDKKVYTNKKVQKELRSNYYYVKLNAEENQTIELNDTTYHYQMSFGRNGVQQLAKKWGTQNGSLKYPTTVILDENYQITRFLDGYLPKNSFRIWLQE